MTQEPCHTSRSRIIPRWSERTLPLAPAGVIAGGEDVAGLARSCASRISRGARLGGSVGHDRLVVIGDRDDLPWSSGAQYLGWEANLLVPTTHEPEPSAAVLSRAALGDADDHHLVILLPGLLIQLPHPRHPMGVDDLAVLLAR